MAARKWTDEQKAAQSAKIRNWKPWNKSTGAITPEGKAISSMNAHRGYFRRRARLGQWLLAVKNNTGWLTPELIDEFKERTANLNLFKDDDEQDEYIQHYNNVEEIAVANVKAAYAASPEKIIDLCHLIRILKATAVIIR
jgi:hypothetical protein